METEFKAMETEFKKMIQGVSVALMLAITGCDDRKTNDVLVLQTNAPQVTTGVVVSNACVTADASKEPSIEDDIKSFAEGLAGDAELQATWTIGTNVVARIAQEEDVAEFRKHIGLLQEAILGVRFREGPLADSYYDWCWSIDIFDHMGNQCVNAMWKRTQEMPWICDFRLKQMAILKREMERIADAKPKPDPPNFEGVHPTLDMVQSTLKTCLRHAYERTFLSRAFRKYYDSLSPMEKDEWNDRMGSQEQHFK